MSRRICVITGSRAEYGLLRFVMRGIQTDPSMELQLVATGMHMSPEFGLTYREIEADGFVIDRKVEMLTSSDTAVGTAKSMGLGLIAFGEVFDALQPDLVLVLGDRFEIFAAVAAATVARIPVAHLQGGESTEGAFDEAFRHSITKMSQLHFVAADRYRQRVIQLGEMPDRVFLVGGLGIDAISRVKLLDRASLETALDFRFGPRNLLVTFHPATLDVGSPADQMRELLEALSEMKETHVIFTLSNADTEGRRLGQMVEDFVAEHSFARAFQSLGQLRYLSVIAQVDAVVGNSSSGILEVPSFKKATVNIGDRQRGRLSAASVIDCEPTRASIAAALSRALSSDFQDDLRHVRSPYGEPGASDRIVSTIRDFPLAGLTKKAFYDSAAEDARSQR